MSIGDTSVSLSKLEDKCLWSWFVMHFAFTLWYVLACWLRPDYEKGTAKYLYAGIGGLFASVFQGLYLYAHITGRKPSQVAMVACYTMPYVCWILFALLGRATSSTTRPSASTTGGSRS